MAMTVEARGVATPNWLSLSLASVAVASAEQALTSLDSSLDGLSSAEAQRRLEVAGPNALRSHGAQPLAVLARQLRNPLLVLLLGAALTSFFVGERLDALIIFLISGLSIGLGFFNEYRSERAVEALHSQLRHTALVVRDGKPQRVDVTELVPGDVVRIEVGDVVAADLRLLRAEGLECDESVLTGESLRSDADRGRHGNRARRLCHPQRTTRTRPRRLRRPLNHIKPLAARGGDLPRTCSSSLSRSAGSTTRSRLDAMFGETGSVRIRLGPCSQGCARRWGDG